MSGGLYPATASTTQVVERATRTPMLAVRRSREFLARPRVNAVRVAGLVTPAHLYPESVAVAACGIKHAKVMAVESPNVLHCWTCTDARLRLTFFLAACAASPSIGESL